MKVTLIKLDTKTVEVPDYRPFLRELVRPGFEPLEANYEGMEATYIPRDIKTVDYRVVEMRGYKKGEGENGLYLVNDDMWNIAMPILEDIARQRAIPLEKENVDLRIEIKRQSNTINALRNSWWERFKRFTKLSKPL